MMKRILVIEDDTTVRLMVSTALEQEGYQVLVAENGVEGMRLARAQAPDLVLCDVQMEELDGYGTLEALRQDPGTRAIPFILMTGQAHRAGMRHGMELGADDYLPKPFAVQELCAAVRARLKKQVILREQADQRLAQLRTNISYALPHELRTPLNGIIGFSDLILADYDSLSAEQLLGMVRAIRQSADRLHRQIENTLLYAQLELAAADEARVQSLRRAGTADLATVASKAARQRATAAGRGADLCLALHPVRVGLPPDHLTRLVDELMDNALRFSQSGTPVHVATQADGQWGCLTISDAGRGMQPEHVAAVGAYMQFERKCYEQQGAGLGLAIATRLAEIHGGSLLIGSELGVGTKVTVTLPAAETAPGSLA